MVVHPEYLSFATMRQKVSEALRHRDLRGDEPVIAYMDLLGRTYRQNAAEASHGAPPPGAKSRTPP